jgi:hypothetical protein
MNPRAILLSVLLALPLPVIAQDSVTRASNASGAASVHTSQAIGWVAYAGSQLTVGAIKATAQGVEIVLRGASTGIETSALVTRDVLEGASVAVGTTVSVVADASGYLLVAAGKTLAYVPSEAARALLHRSPR